MERSSPPQMKPSQRVQSFSSCAACGLPLNSTSGPHLLPCLHTVCKDCVSLSSKVKECPVCKETYELREVISNLLFAELCANLRDSVKCHGCEDPSVSGWCVECQEALCTGCVADHKRVKTAQEHYIHTITAEHPRPIVCPIHNKELANSYCLTCDQLTCKLCRPFHHRHLLQDAHAAVGKQRKQIQKMVQKVQQKRLTVQKDRSDLEGRLSDLEELEARVRLEVKEMVVRLCNMIVKKAAKLNKEIKDLCGKEKEKLSERRSLLQRLEEKLDHVLAFTDKAVASQHHTALLSCKRQVHHQLQNLMDQVVSPTVTVTEIAFQSNEDNVKKVIKSFGSITAKEVPLTCSSSWNLPGPSPDHLRPDFSLSAATVTSQKPSHASTAALSSPPSVSLQQLNPQPSKKQHNSSPKKTSSLPTPASFSFSSSQSSKYSIFPNLKRAWSYHPYHPRDQVAQSSVKSVSSPNRRRDPIPSSRASPSQPTTPVSSLLRVSAPGPSASVKETTSAATPPACSSKQTSCGQSSAAFVEGHQNNGHFKVNLLKWHLATSAISSQKTKAVDVLPTVLLLPAVQATIASSGPALPPGGTQKNKEEEQPAASTGGVIVQEGEVFNTVASTAENRQASFQTAKVTPLYHCPPTSGSVGGVQSNKLVKHSPVSATVAPFRVVSSSSLHSRAPSPSNDASSQTVGSKVWSPAVQRPLASCQGGLAGLGSLGRDWLPDVLVTRLAIPDFPSSSSAPSFHVTWNEESNSCQLSVIEEKNQCAAPDPVATPGYSGASRPLLGNKLHCAACRIKGKLFQCSVCQSAFHRECHLPPVLATDGEQWQCMLCRDMSHFELYQQSDGRPSPYLSPRDQKKCEYLLLSLSCNKRSSVLYRPVQLSSQTARYIDMTLVRGRLLQKLTPPYHTPGEFVSDVWLLLHTLLNSSKEVQPVKQLQRFFSKELTRVFGERLHPSLLNNPFTGSPEEREPRRTDA